VIRRIVLSAGWLAASALLAALLLHNASGDELRLARYTGYLMPWLLLGIVPGAAWAWWARSHALAWVLALSASLVVAAHVPEVHVPAATGPRPAPGQALSVMSYNTWSRNGDDREIARVVLRSAPDLVLLQEIPRPVFERLLGNLGDLYGGRTVHAAYEPAVQQAVVSRYPLGPSTVLEEKGRAQKVVLRTPAGPITVFNVHPLRERGWKHRYEQMAALLEEEVLREPNPVIVAGDVNAPEHSEVYALVASRLENAHRAAGSGFGFTYPAPGRRVLRVVPAFPVVRIDHVFFSRHLVALRSEVLDDPGGSDHLPILAVLALADRGEAERPAGSRSVAAAGAADAAAGAKARGGGDPR
jgi:vancomycin resistance protein VanJ